MSNFTVLSPQQYARMYNLLDEDKMALLALLVNNREKFIHASRRYPLEIEWRSQQNAGVGFRCVLCSGSMNADSVDFIINTLTLMLK